MPKIKKNYKLNKEMSSKLRRYYYYVAGNLIAAEIILQRTIRTKKTLDRRRPHKDIFELQTIFNSTISYFGLMGFDQIKIKSVATVGWMFRNRIFLQCFVVYVHTVTAVL